MTYPEFVHRERARARLRRMAALAFVIGAFAAMLAWSCTAHALVLGDAAAPGLFDTVVKPALVAAALSPTVWATVVLVAYAIAAHFKWSRAQAIKDAIEKAFGIVEDLKATGKLPPGAAKPVVALEELHKLLGAEGITVTDAIVALAKASWSAMHGQQKAASA